jgi:hypothetical protein
MRIALLVVLSGCVAKIESDTGVTTEILARLDADDAQLAALEAAVDPTPEDRELTASDIQVVKALVADCRSGGCVRHDTLAADVAAALAVDSLDDVVRVISTDTNYPVSSAQDLEATLKLLDSYRIGAGARVTIQLADGDYDFTAADVVAPLEIRHPDGASIYIVGNLTRYAAVKLEFPASTDGIVVDHGHALGLLAGVTVLGPNLNRDAPAHGILARNGSTITVGDNTLVEGFVFGVEADKGSVVDANPSVFVSGWLTVTACVYGVSADHSSFISARYVESSSNAGFGFIATNSSAIDADYANASSNLTGMTSGSASAIEATYSTSSNNTSFGYEVHQNSYADAAGAISRDNLYGVMVEGYGYLDMLGGKITGSTSTDLIQQAMGAIAVNPETEIPGSVIHAYNAPDDYIVDLPY